MGVENTPQNGVKNDQKTPPRRGVENTPFWGGQKDPPKRGVRPPLFGGVDLRGKVWSGRPFWTLFRGAPAARFSGVGFALAGIPPWRSWEPLFGWGNVVTLCLVGHCDNRSCSSVGHGSCVTHNIMTSRIRCHGSCNITGG